MRRQKIGKIQLIIGIILLIVGIVGLVIVFNIGHRESEIRPARIMNSINKLLSDETFQSNSNETRAILILNEINTQDHDFNSSLNLLINIGLGLSLLIIISLLFITQGLANMSKEETKYK